MKPYLVIIVISIIFAVVLSFIGAGVVYAQTNDTSTIFTTKTLIAMGALTVLFFIGLKKKYIKHY